MGEITSHFITFSGKKVRQFEKTFFEKTFFCKVEYDRRRVQHSPI